MIKMTIKRGEIYMVYFGEIIEEGGSVQQGMRPAMILQNNVGNKFSTTTIVAPISTSSREFFPTHVDLSGTEGLEFGSKIMLEQIRTINKSELIGEAIAKIHPEDMIEINRAIMRSLGIIS